MKTKIITIQVEVKVPVFLTKRETVREVRTLINEQSGWLSGKYIGDDWFEIEIKTKKVKAI